MSRQTISGKSFEYALALTYFEYLNQFTTVVFVESKSVQKAKSSFYSLNTSTQSLLKKAGLKSIEFIINIEPRLQNSIGTNDLLHIEIAGDSRGQKGDVRDVIFLRSEQNWQIGFSAKNNHRALKHSRLSHKLDFGESWIKTPCSKSYWNSINPIFKKLQDLKNKSRTTLWSDAFKDKYKEVYTPILAAFREEVIRFSSLDPDNFATNFVQYLIGRNDFYKIINRSKKIEIHGYNINGTLNQKLNNIKPKDKVGLVKLPTRLIEIEFKPNHLNTLIATFDEGWQISFRIHSASSKVESSLKFDINLISNPSSLFKTDIFL